MRTRKAFLLALGLALLVCSPAFGATPELGRCQKLTAEIEPPHRKVYHGGYTNSACTKPSAGKTGKFEWTPGAGAAAGFTGVSRNPVLFIEGNGSFEPVTKCAGASYEGKYTGTRTFTETIALSGCSHAEDTCVEALDGSPPECPEPCGETPECIEEFRPCSNTETAGEVTSTLEGELGLLAGTKPAKKRVAVKLSGTIGAECGSGGEDVFAVGGSLFSLIRPAVKMTSTLSMGFNTHDPTSFEGEAAPGFSARPNLDEEIENTALLEVRVLE